MTSFSGVYLTVGDILGRPHGWTRHKIKILLGKPNRIGRPGHRRNEYRIERVVAAEVTMDTKYPQLIKANRSSASRRAAQTRKMDIIKAVVES